MDEHALRDNVAQFALLSCHSEDGKEATVLIANTHLLFNPRRGDIKVFVCMCLLMVVVVMCVCVCDCVRDRVCDCDCSGGGGGGGGWMGAREGEGLISLIPFLLLMKHPEISDLIGSIYCFIAFYRWHS